MMLQKTRYDCGFNVSGALILVPVASHLSDRYGRRRVLLVSMYLSAIFSFVTAFSPTYTVFVALRFLVGATADVSFFF